MDNETMTEEQAKSEHRAEKWRLNAAQEQADKDRDRKEKQRQESEQYKDACENEQRDGCGD